MDTCACPLVQGKALGWFQGGMEFRPRALGARSILGDARSQSLLNLKVKYWEWFRPICAFGAADDAAGWFELDAESPYMPLVADVVEHRRKPMTPEQQSSSVSTSRTFPEATFPR